ncbi:MAG: radical SAM protein [Geobacteraceae bacterium]|nr:radical SAM protein [Geobacteraceae bacterium]
MNSNQRAWKLIRNGIRYRRLKSGGKPYRLEAISLEITHRCICKCSMCNIWKIPANVPDLDLSDWLALLSSPELRHLRELDLTGGEPFLRTDLGELLQLICDLQPTNFPGLRTLSITTNGILTGKVLEITRRIIGQLQYRGIDLVLACGMDAVGELHDRIRNFRGAWENLQKTLEELYHLRTIHPNLVLGIKTTVVPQNARALARISEYAERNNLFTIISPCIITTNRFGNADREIDLKFSSEELDAIIRFYENPGVTWNGHREALLGYLKSGRINKPCSAGYNTIFVRHNGEVFCCPVLPVSLGNIKDQTLSELFRSTTADRFRKMAGNYPECSTCTEPGMERIAWPFEGFAFLRLMAGMGRIDADHLVLQMGLDKYLQCGANSGETS